MELFLDDPNIDVDTPERNYIVRSYVFCFFISIIPPLSAITAYILTRNKKFGSSFSKQHLNNLFKLQLIILISSFISIFEFLRFYGNKSAERG